MIRILSGWLAAVVAAAVAGSLVQSSFTLAALGRIHEPVGLRDRLVVYTHDLLHFAPLWAAVMGLALLIAFVAAGWLGQRNRRWRPALFPLAGLVATLTALLVMEAMLPVTLIAAARSLLGIALMCLGGVLGGAVYLSIVPYRQKGQN